MVEIHEPTSQQPAAQQKFSHLTRNDSAVESEIVLPTAVTSLLTRSKELIPVRCLLDLFAVWEASCRRLKLLSSST